MSLDIQKITKKVLEGNEITKKEALELIKVEDDRLEELLEGANKIREKYMGSKVDLCTIMNGKSGRCSEDCKYCAQSSHYKTDVKEYGYLSYEEIFKRAEEVASKGAHRFSLVTSGRGLKESKEISYISKIYKRLSKEVDIKLCASHGIIDYETAKKLKESGVSMYHHNIETSRNYYSKICSTHEFEDRVNTIKAVQQANISVCCGGIIGMGESLEDRVDMAFEIKNLNIKSIPINILNSIKGTPFEKVKAISKEEILKCIAVFRYVNKDAYIRYAGGRLALESHQEKGFKGGINAALVGDYLTTIGNNIDEDKKMIKRLGLEI